MKKLFSHLKKTLVLALVLLLSTSPSLAWGQTSVNARPIVVLSVDGDNAALYRGISRSITPRPGMRLATGHQLATGADTNLLFRLDTDSVVKMDEESRVEVSTSLNRLSLNIPEGQSLVHLAPKEPNQQFDASVGSLTFEVTGTMFVIGHGVDYVYIVLLSGSGEVNGTPVSAGYRIISWQDENGDIHTLIIGIIPEDLNNFTLQAIWDNQDYLSESGDFITEEFLEEVSEILNRRTQEPVRIRSENDDDRGNGGIIGNGDNDIGDNGANGDNGDNDVQMLLPGSGTATDPFRIETFRHMQYAFTPWDLDTSLAQISPHRNAYFILMNNITLAPGWQIPGTFNGNFNGAGNTITWQNLQGADGGLFEFIGEDGIVQNLILRGNVDSGSKRGNIGGFTTWNWGKLSNVGFIGSVTSSNFQSVGGIVGQNEPSGIITNSFFSGNIISYGPVGGIAGANWGDIRNSFSEGSLSFVEPNIASTVGGIVGLNMGRITDVYSTADIKSLFTAGGIVGNNTLGMDFTTGAITFTGEVIRGYSTSSIDILDWGSAGGISGYTYGSSLGRVVAINSSIDGFLGYRISGCGFIHGGSMATAYAWEGITLGSAINNTDGTTVTTERLLEQDFWANNLGFDFNNTWTFNPGSLPTLTGVGHGYQRPPAIPVPLFAPLQFPFIFCEICEEYPCICEYEEYEYYEYEYNEYYYEYEEYKYDLPYLKDPEEGEEDADYNDDLDTDMDIGIDIDETDKKEPEDDELKEIEAEEEDEAYHPEEDYPVIDDTPPGDDTIDSEVYEESGADKPYEIYEP